MFQIFGIFWDLWTFCDNFVYAIYVHMTTTKTFARQKCRFFKNMYNTNAKRNTSNGSWIRSVLFQVLFSHHFHMFSQEIWQISRPGSFFAFRLRQDGMQLLHGLSRLDTRVALTAKRGASQGPTQVPKVKSTTKAPWKPLEAETT